MNFLKKIQSLDLAYRKFIFWFIIIGLVTGLGILFFKNSKKKLESLKESNFLEDLNFPSFGQELKNLWPEELDQKIEEIDKMIEEIEKVDL